MRPGPRTRRPLRAYLWVAPITLAGLALAALACLAGASARRVDGVLEVGGARRLRGLGRLPGLRGVEAITLGHVILGRDHATLARWRHHEQVHVRQHERWGPLFWPLYLGGSLRAWLRGGDAYRDNPFECEAFSAEPGPARSADAGPRRPPA